jgi:excisionase family DNA binding protein
MRYLTTQQAAELLGLHRTTVLRLVEAGTIRAQVLRYGQRATIRIPEDAIAEFRARWTDPDDVNDPYERRR